jgi:hypothetical protein
MALDTPNSPATDVKPVHPQPAPAGTDATHATDTTKKADAPIGGGLVAATLADVRKIASAVEKPIVADLKSLNTLVFTPIESGSAMSGTAKPTDNSAAAKAPGSSATGEKAASKPGSNPSPAAQGDAAANAAKPGQPGQPAATDASQAAAATSPDPNANKSIYTKIFETAASVLGVPEAVVNLGESLVGAAWDSVGNYATDLLSDSNLQKSIVSTSKDGQLQIDQQKASQVIDMQAIKNVFQGASGDQHILQINKMFSQVSASNPDLGKGKGDPNSETAAYKALDAQRTQMLAAGHKPGDSWSDSNGVYSLDKAGDLLQVTGSKDSRDIKWIGQNGQSYEKDPSGNETWTKDGNQIKQLGAGNFQFTDSFGNVTTVDGKGAAGRSVYQVADGTITSYNQNRTAITRAAAAQITDGISTNPNAALYSHHDADGNQLVKDSLVHGETVFAKDGQNYHVHDGQVYLEDQQGNDQAKPLDQLPSFIKRLPNGDLQFDDVTIDKKDSMTASDFNTQMADQSTSITAGPAEHQLTVKAVNNTVTVAVKAEFTATSHTDTKTGVTTVHQVGPSGQNEFDYNSKTGTMAGDGITFTKNGTHIRGTAFAVTAHGEIESASSWDAQNYSSGIYDASDAYIRAMGNYSESRNNNSNGGNGEGSSDGNGNGGNDGSGDGGSDSDDAPDSYKEYDEEKEREEKADEKQLSMWDALQTKLQAQAAKIDAETGDNKLQQDIKSGKLFELPETLKVAGIKNSVNVSGVQASIGRSDQGTVDTGDVASLETAKAQLGSAASKFGFDADGYLSQLDGVEAKVEREVRVKAALQDVGADANPNHMWRVHMNGGTVSAARELEEQESA